jgi:hypothetical protein
MTPAMVERPDESPELGDVPAGLMEVWIDAVARMDVEVLDSFITRMRKNWAASALGPLEEAVACRRAELARGGHA